MAGGGDNDWDGLNFAGPPRLLVGWRSPATKRLDARRVRLEQAVYGELAELCTPAIARLSDSRSRPFEPFAALEPGEEYFSIDISDLPHHPPLEAARDAEVDDDIPDLVRLVRTVDGLDEVSREGLAEHKLSFSAICWPHRQTMVGFVSKSDPTTTLHPGFRYFQFGDTLRRAEHPDIVLRPGADILVGVDSVAVINPTAYNVLLADVGVAFEGVLDHVKEIKNALRTRAPLTTSAAAAVEAVASRKVSVARRLAALPGRLVNTRFTAAELQASIEKHEIDPARLLDSEGSLDFEEDHVELFLDVVEGRYFEDDLSDELRRADRFSTR